MVQEKRYIKTQGCSTMKGEWYEVKVAALLFLRSKNSSQVSRFQLATNVAGAGALDDIVYRMVSTEEPLIWYTWFIQLKQTIGSTRLTEDAFTGPSGAYSLKKYLKSFIGIKYPNPVQSISIDQSISSNNYNNNDDLFNGSFDHFQFVIYTNLKAEKKIMENQKRKMIANPQKIGRLEKLLKANATHELIFTINKEYDTKFFKFLNETKYTTSDDINIFLEKLIVFSGQPTESELDDVIKKELVIACAVSDAGPIYRIFEGLFKQWWQYSDIIIDETSDILQKATDQLSSETELMEQTKQCTLDLTFNENLWKNFNTSFSKGVTVLHVFTTGLSVRLTATKILHILHEEKLFFTIIGLDYLLKHKSTLIFEWRDGYKDCLVIIVSDSQDSDNQNALVSLITDINGVLRSTSNKRAIVVSRQICLFANYLTESLNAKKTKSVNGTFNFTDLHRISKAKLLGIEVSFQDHKIPLQSLLNEDILKTFISDNLVETLLSKQLISIGSKLPDVIQHFIPRRLKRCTCLKVEILKSEMPSDLFAVSGVTVKELQKLVRHNEKVEQASDHFGRASDPVATSSTFLVLGAGKAVQEYNSLCQTESNVHWIHVERNVLKWIKSKGSVATIRHYVDNSEDTVIQFESLLDTDSKAILVIGEPGMGKTSLLSNLAQTVKTANPADWVIHINLREHSELFNQSTQLSASDFLTSALGIDLPFEQDFLRVSLQQTGNIVVMLDSFDEICPKYEKNGCALLSSILKTTVKKMVVTSRHCMQDVLEDQLSTLAYNIIEFTEDEQKTFFRKYWSQLTTPKTPTQIEDFITQLLDSVKAIDPGKCLMGIPLQTMMLAEVCQDHVMDPQNNEFPQNLDIINLFNTFINKKFEIFFTKGNTFLNDEDAKKKFFDDHMYAALTLLLPERDIQNLQSEQNIVSNAHKFVTNINEGKENSGIVINIVNHKPNFLHQMFAEYFAGMWFTEHYYSNRAFLNDNLFLPQYNVIRTMCDRIMSHGYKLHEAVLDKDILLLEQLLTMEGSNINSTYKGGRTALHLAAALGFDVTSRTLTFDNDIRFIGPRPRHMVELLLTHGSDVNIKDAVLQLTPVEYVLKTKSWNSMEYLLESQAKSKHLILSKQIMKDQNFLKAVFDNRFFRILTLFLKQESLVNKHVSRNRNFLLHWASHYGYLEFVELLLSKGANTRARDVNNNIPLHIASRAGHVSVVRFLIENSSKIRVSNLFGSQYKLFYWFRKYVNTTNSSGDSALHLAKFASIVQLLIAYGANIWTRNWQGYTVLHSFSSNNKLSLVQDVMESMKEGRSKIEFINALDVNNFSAIFYAAYLGHSDVIRLLVSHGANVWAVDTRGISCLHQACVGNSLPVAKALIEIVGQDGDAVKKFINILDHKSNSAIALACWRGYTDIVQLLLSHGADVWAVDNRGRTCLHDACMINKLPIANALIESLGQDEDAVKNYINMLDNDGSSAIALACWRGYTDVVQLLLSHGADVWAVDKRGRTCLHEACMKNQLPVVKSVIESFGRDRDAVKKYINILDNEGNSAISAAFEKRYLELDGYFLHTMQMYG